MSIETPRNRPSGPSASQPVYMVYPSDQEDGINLIELANMLWRQKWLICGVTGFFAVAGVAYAFLATPIYRAEALLAPNASERELNLPAGLGGLASFAGISLPSSEDGTEAVATLRSRAFVEEFIDENSLLPVLFADEWDAENETWIEDATKKWPDIRDGVEFFTEEIRFVTEDGTTGLVTLAIEWIDPQLAAKWVGDLVQRINERLRAQDLANSERRLQYLNRQLEAASLVELRQAISQLIQTEIQTIMLAQAEPEYAFKVIDPPRVPKEHITPRRALMVVLAVFFGLVAGIFVALFRRVVVSHHDDDV